MIEPGRYSFGTQHQWDIEIDKIDGEMVYYTWCPGEGGYKNALPVSDIESVLSDTNVKRVYQFKDYLAQL